MICPASAEMLAVYLPDHGINLADLPPRTLTARRDHIRHLRSVREFAAAERWGWLTLTGVILGVPDITDLTLDHPTVPLHIVEPLTPATTIEHLTPTSGVDVEVIVDPAGERLFHLACATGSTVDIAGRQVATGAAHDDIRRHLSGMVPS